MTLFTKMMIKSIRLVSLSIIISNYLVGCAVPEESNNPPDSTNSFLSINNVAVIPVTTGMQAAKTSVPIYVHNNGDKLITNITYTTEYHFGEQIIITKINQCNQIAAKSRCELLITLPQLTNTKVEDSLLLKASYVDMDAQNTQNNSSKNKITSQIINFKQVTSKIAGVFFTDAVKFTKDSYTTLYVYGGQERDYQVENITGDDISDINKMQHIGLLKNHLLAIEVKPNKNQKIIINATSMGDKLYLKNNMQTHSAEISVNLSPIANGPILINGTVPIVQTSTSATTASILIMNSGNQATSAITVTYPTGVVAATGSGACDLNLGLVAHANCTLYFTVSAPSTGSGVIMFNYGGSATLTVPINWYNINTGIIVQMVANPAAVNFTAGGSGTTTVTVTNTGVYALNSLNVSSATASGSATVAISSNTCISSLAANASCTFIATISDTAVEDNKNITVSISGSYNNGSSQTYSRILGVGYTTIAPQPNKFLMYSGYGAVDMFDTTSKILTNIVRDHNSSISSGVVAYGNNQFVMLGYSGDIRASVDGVTWLQQKTGITSQLNSVVYANSKFVAVGNSGVIMTSSNGISWTKQLSNTTASFVSISYGSGKFIATGTGGIIITSLDGITWISQTVSTTYNLGYIGYFNNKFIILGYDYSSSSSIVLISSDGVTWGKSNISGYPSYPGVSFVNGQFVIFGYYGLFLTSPDGVTWTQQSTNIGGAALFSVSYGNGTFVAVGSGGTIITSPDGVTWTKRTSGTTSNLQSVIYINGQFVVSGYNGAILTSLDGVAWAAQNLDIDYNFNLVTYLNNKIMLFDSYRVLTSSNATSWILETNGNMFYITSMRFINNKYFIVCSKGIMTSPDGLIWTQQNTNSLQYLNSISYANGQFVVVGANGVILSSSDGITWIQRTSNTTNYLTSTIYANGKFIAVGSGGTILSSLDGITWTVQNSNISNNLSSVIYANNMFIAISPDSTIITSLDGVTWTQRVSGITRNLSSVIYANGTFVAVGSGVILSSLDGVTWVQKVGFSSLFSIVYASGKFIVVGSGGTILTSSDGVTWSQQVSNTNSDLNSISYANGQFVVVGANGAILTSADGVNWINNPIRDGILYKFVMPY